MPAKHNTPYHVTMCMAPSCSNHQRRRKMCLNHMVLMLHRHCPYERCLLSPQEERKSNPSMRFNDSFLSQETQRGAEHEHTRHTGTMLQRPDRQDTGLREVASGREDMGRGGGVHTCSITCNRFLQNYMKASSIATH